MGYRIDLDRRWHTRRALVIATTISGERRVTVQATGTYWTVDGQARPDLEGCVDVDVESSNGTNTLPLHRLQFVPGQPVQVAAAFVSVNDLSVHRLEQRYTLRSSTPVGSTFDYESTTFDYAGELRFDAAGLILDYPGSAVRDL
ncbi:MAG: hypothetical protein JWP54_611 [Cryobacterium sp.]|nr:hypothetical protein [Cryobacterium sp.]